MLAQTNGNEDPWLITHTRPSLLSVATLSGGGVSTTAIGALERDPEPEKGLGSPPLRRSATLLCSSICVCTGGAVWASGLCGAAATGAAVFSDAGLLRPAGRVAAQRTTFRPGWASMMNDKGGEDDIGRIRKKTQPRREERIFLGAGPAGAALPNRHWKTRGRAPGAGSATRTPGSRSS